MSITEQEFFAAVEATHRTDVANILRRRGMSPAIAATEVQKIDLLEHGDKTAAQLAEIIETAA